ncbi:MAG TPA: 30S ribosomal protein S3 [Candidatus Pacearchaeota archaeon]|mgnify:CR=1 FL=1|nr:30S ribosomal protein S3 [Candidatus Pacearchaeota archaeon]HOK94045.1 30S ribosomal protein S3 [Candidatus Pacearchaeota archaeon]HPO75116.1 30S ribosomal protein S3 [Candidatus Pacearchaeota archaeon]
MAHKVHPKIFRIGSTEDWDASWLSDEKYQKNLKEDIKIRNFLAKEFERGVIEKVKISRLANKINITIRTAKPGFLIGKGGQGAENLSKKIAEIIKGKEIKIDIEEVKEPLMSATIVADQIAADIERRVPFRRAIKRSMERVLQKKEIEGIKIKIKGRLDGVEIARSETFKKGKLPLQTIRANVDYAETRAYCTYGVVGIKVWLYKGEKI